MANHNYEIQVNSSIAVLMGDGARPTHVCQNLGETVTFVFDKEWDGAINDPDIAIKALFIWNGKYTSVWLDENNSCKIPIIFDSNVFYVGAFAGDDPEEEPYLTTTRVEIPCLLSVKDYAKTPQPTHGKEWHDVVQELADKASESAKSAGISAQEAAESATIANDAKEHAVNLFGSAEQIDVAIGAIINGQNQILGKTPQAVMLSIQMEDTCDVEVSYFNDNGEYIHEQYDSSVYTKLPNVLSNVYISSNSNAYTLEFTDGSIPHQRISASNTLGSVSFDPYSYDLEANQDHLFTYYTYYKS